MPTSAVFTFNDGIDSFSVYMAYDGDPTSAADYINRAFRIASQPFDAGDFAAAFVESTYGYIENDVKLCHTPVKTPYEFYYHISSNGKDLIVGAYRENGDSIHIGALAEYTAYVNS